MLLFGYVTGGVQTSRFAAGVGLALDSWDRAPMAMVEKMVENFIVLEEADGLVRR